MNETSLKAFWENKLGHMFQPKEVRIIDDLCVHGPGTRSELAARTGLKLSCVCGRVNSLIKHYVLEEFDRKRDDETGKLVNVVRLKEKE